MAESRGQSVAQIDAIGGGRIWTGVQALERGLVDELGNLQSALAKARALAKLPEAAAAVLLRGKGKPIGAQVAEQNPAALAQYVVEGIELLSNRAQCIMPFEWWVEWGAEYECDLYDRLWRAGIQRVHRAIAKVQN